MKKEEFPYPNIESQLAEWIKTRDEQLFNDVIYSYLLIIAKFEMQNHAFCREHWNSEMMHDLVSHAVEKLPLYKEEKAKRMTRQSWVRFTMKQKIFQMFHSSQVQKNNRKLNMSLDDLMNQGFDMADDKHDNLTYNLPKMNDILDRLPYHKSSQKHIKDLCEELKKALNDPDTYFPASLTPRSYIPYIHNKVGVSNSPLLNIFAKIRYHINKPLSLLESKPTAFIRRCPSPGCNREIKYGSKGAWKKANAHNYKCGLCARRHNGVHKYHIDKQPCTG